MARAAGDIAKTIGIEIVSRAVDATIGVTKGDIVGFDSAGAVRTASITNTTSNVVSGYGISLETVAGGAGNARIAVGNTYMYATSSTGAAVPFVLVGQEDTSPSTAGGFLALTFADTATNSALSFGQLVGRYMGHEGEEDNPTAATTAEVGILRLGL